MHKKMYGVALAALLMPLSALSQEGSDAKTKTDEAPKPPELTLVTGRLMKSESEGAAGGVAYFVFQRRLLELPHANALDKAKAMAETSVAIDAGGSFSLSMAPGNYALIYDPAAQGPVDSSKAGPESIAANKRRTREQFEALKAVFQENSTKGIPIAGGKLESAFVIENRAVRPPVVDFGEMLLGADHSITVRAMTAKEQLVDFPVSLHLRGHNGDILEPHMLSQSEPATFHFFDAFPQPYQVFATGQRPKPGSGAGDKMTTPTIGNAAFVFEGKPMEIKVTVNEGSAEAPSQEPPAAAGSEEATKKPASTTRRTRSR